MTTLSRRAAPGASGALRAPGATWALGAALTVLAASCSSSDGSSGTLPVFSSVYSATGAAPISIQERWFAYLADEASTGTGTDLNGDSDSGDQVPVVIDVATRVERLLAVAAQDLHVLNAQVYLVVDEAADGQNWETPSDLGTNTVLLHWSVSSGTLVYVDTLADTSVVTSGNLLVYSSMTAAPSSANETSIVVIDAGSAPLVQVPIPSDDAAGPLSPVLLSEDEGLVFLALDETVEGRDLNGDADSTDAFVLALLDGTTTAGTVLGTGLAVQDGSVPRRANALGPGDWLVGFLVSEAAQGNVSLNDMADFAMGWQPTQCGMTADTDAVDQVLHYIRFAAWELDPMMSPPRNSGIAGTRRVVAVANHVGTISSEVDATCDLNNDMDTLDLVFRWTEAVAAPADVLPETDEDLLVATFDAPGGTRGITELDDRFIVVVDEAGEGTDIDGDGMADDVVLGWHNPAATATSLVYAPFVGVSWVGELESRALLPVGYLERYSSSTNGDGDTTDTFPAWGDFDGGFTVLGFAGITRAVVPTNPGIVLVNNLAFFRVSEAEDGRDHTGDGMLDDFALFRSGIVPSFVAPVAAVTNDTRPAIDVGSPAFGGGFLAPEDGVADFNGDGDMADVVFRWIRF